jgi:hypothetical protein
MKLIEEATKEDEELPGQGGRTVRGHMDEALKTKNRVHKLHYGRQTLSQQFTAVPMGESCSEDPPK